MRGIYSVTLENQSGALSKTAGLFARRGFNIDSLAVGETENSDVSHMTIVSTGDERTLEQIEKQLNKKIDVIKVRRLDPRNSIELEAVMIKVNYTKGTRTEIVEICGIMNAQIIHLGTSNMIISYFGSPENCRILIGQLKNFGILEISRTGSLAMQK